MDEAKLNKEYRHILKTVTEIMAEGDAPLAEALELAALHTGLDVLCKLATGMKPLTRARCLSRLQAIDNGSRVQKARARKWFLANKGIDESCTEDVPW